MVFAILTSLSSTVIIIHLKHHTEYICMCKESIIIVSLCRNGCWFDFWIWASGKSWDNVFLHQSLLSVGENYNTGLKGQPDKAGMSHPSLAIHSCSLCGLITPPAPKSATRIEVPSEFPKVQLHSQQEPWTWLQNSQAGIAVTSFNSPDCRFFSGNILAFQGSPGTSIFNGRNQDPKADMVFTLQNRGGILQSSLPGNRQIATFSDRHHLDFLIFTLLGPHSLISLVLFSFSLAFKWWRHLRQFSLKCLFSTFKKFALHDQTSILECPGEIARWASLQSVTSTLWYTLWHLGFPPHCGGNNGLHSLNALSQISDLSPASVGLF